ncbi:MAG: sulfite exporter TauE/SafE family protein [Elusimicrobia bacterium]|nr:sulfite exporter TauE/SafE family protein [Candidatus Liberimonas magnetica]
MIEGFLLGLSNNLGCFAVCSPVLLPFLLSETRSSVFPVLKFLTGRLIAYLFFAAFFGSLGLYFDGRINPRFFSVLTLILSLWLIGFAFGRINLNLSVCRTANKLIPGENFPLLAGIVMGLNICPPFLLGLNKILEMGSVAGSIIFFLGFYFGSSVWVAILIFAGQVSRFKPVKLLAQTASILVGFWYLYTSIFILTE